MRLTDQEQQIIKTTILHYDPVARVLLFGSRVDDSKRGDIDLLVISYGELLTHTLGFPDKLQILADLHQQLGDQKIDLVPDDGSGTFARSFLPEAIDL